MKTYTVRVGDSGPTVQVTADGWLAAAERGAEQLGVGKMDVQVWIDDRVGFVSPKCVTM